MRTILDITQDETAVTDASAVILEQNDYLPFGTRVSLSAQAYDPSNRYRFNGKEEQVTGNIGLIDYGARLYDNILPRWTTPDPLAEKYYSYSPYAFCNNNPVNFVDPDGEAVETLWDIASIGMGVRSFVQNIKSGNVSGAVGDAVGIAIDAVAAAVPFVPGGVGAVRAGAKAVNAIDNAADVAKGVGNVADNATDVAKTAAAFSDGKTYVTYTKVNPKTGEVYSGRASGYGTPEEVVANRDRNHHMNEKGFEKAKLDRFSTNPDAIRGREQQLIELNGGAKSQGGSSGNAINGISPTNPKRQRYEDARRKEFGQ